MAIWGIYVKVEGSERFFGVLLSISPFEITYIFFFKMRFSFFKVPGTLLNFKLVGFFPGTRCFFVFHVFVGFKVKSKVLSQGINKRHEGFTVHARGI